MSKISKMKLGDIGKISMCKRILKSQTSPIGEVPFYKISTFGGKADCFITRKLFEEYKNKYSFPKKGEILISAAGTLGKTVVYNGEEAFFQDSNIVWVDNDEKFVLNDFLYYYYQLKPWKKTTGSTIERLYNNNLRDINVVFPTEINEQKRIINVLKTIDNKIKNNNKINKELEQMVKTIYDYWFLQYEFPNEEGKPYKSLGGKMVWNEELKKEIPDGWKLKKIVEIEDNIVTGKTPSTKDETNFGGEIPFVTIDDIRKGMYISKTERTLSKKGADLQKNKYIPANSLCITCIATVGLVGITTRQSQTNQQINSIICKNTNNIYFLLNAIRNYFKFSTGAKSGNIFDNMNKEDFSNIKLIYPNKNIIDKYAQKVKPVYDKIRENFLENEELTSLRDYLLPLLMNGQVGFKN